MSWKMIKLNFTKEWICNYKTYRDRERSKAAIQDQLSLFKILFLITPTFLFPLAYEELEAEKEAHRATGEGHSRVL